MAVVALFALSGCVGTEANPTADKADKAVKKAGATADKATKKADDTVKKVETKAEVATEASPGLPESSLKDQAVDKAVEVADEHTDGAASKVIESVQ